MQQPVFFMYLQGDLVEKTRYRDKFLCIQYSSSANVILNFLHDHIFPSSIELHGEGYCGRGAYNTALFYAHKIILLLSNSKRDLNSVFTRQIYAVL